MILISQIFKSDISPHYRQFYIFDNKLLIDFKHIVSIDTLHINVKLSKDQLNYLLNTYTYKHLRKDSIFKFYISSNNIFIKLCTDYPLSHNVQIQLQDASNIDKTALYIDLIKLLYNSYHYFTRLDIAYDFLVPFKFSYALKRHGKQRRKAVGEQSYNTGSTRNKQRKMTTAHYNRNLKLQSKVEYANRFECRTQFQAKDNCTIHNINHDFIREQLNKELFIPNYHLYFDNEIVKLIDSSKTIDNENIIKDTLSRKQYSDFRKKFKARSVDLSTYYNQALHNGLYDFLSISKVTNEQAIDELLA